jgi:hypothetical protein
MSQHEHVNLHNHVHNGWTTNVDIDLRRGMDYVANVLKGEYDHSEIITYGEHHNQCTIIIHFKKKLSDI